MNGSETADGCDSNSGTPTQWRNSNSNSNMKQKRPRAAQDDDDEHEAKRNQPLSIPAEQVQVHEQEIVHKVPILPSVEDLLSVPTAFIFRKVPSSSSFNNAEGNRNISMDIDLTVKQKPLLSRSEAQCFCKINLLAHEIDCLTQICTQIWQTQLQWQTFSQSLEAVDHPYLRPLIVLLDTFTQQTPSSALPQIAVELNRVVSELQQATVTLRQCSEQNWALAESLQDTATTGHLLALEKQKLSDVQEEICHRIDQLIARNASCTDAMETTGSDDQCSNMSTGTSCRGSTGPVVSMDEYCSRIFALESEIPVTREKASDGDYNNKDEDEILSEPDDDAMVVPQKTCEKSHGRGTMPHQTPSPPQQKSTTSQSALFYSTMSSTPQTTQSHANALSKSRVGSEEKENSQQSQRSSQSATASNHRHRGAADALANTFHATGELMIGDEFDHHGADSQDAAHVLSALAATTMERASDCCGSAVRSWPTDRH